MFNLKRKKEKDSHNHAETKSDSVFYYLPFFVWGESGLLLPSFLDWAYLIDNFN
jgi:hypothetical protein